MGMELCRGRNSDLGVRSRVPPAFLALTSFHEKTFFDGLPRLWIILLMIPSAFALGNRPESQTGRGIRRVNGK
jgi:hypothetical protein